VEDESSVVSAIEAMEIEIAYEWNERMMSDGVSVSAVSDHYS
jgi:hypothetical protein